MRKTYILTFSDKVSLFFVNTLFRALGAVFFLQKTIVFCKIQTQYKNKQVVVLLRSPFIFKKPKHSYLRQEYCLFVVTYKNLDFKCLPNCLSRVRLSGRYYMF